MCEALILVGTVEQNVEKMVGQAGRCVQDETPSILICSSILHDKLPTEWADQFAVWNMPIETWDLKQKFLPLVNVYNAFHQAYRYDWIFYIHDDVTIFDPHWIEKMRRTIRMYPEVGVIGFGGANELGDPCLYKVPYEKSQLRRSGYWSNVVDAEKHGIRYPGVQKVATVDGFCLGVKTELLDKAGGWPIGKLRFHNYDHWVCLMARRFGYDVLGYGIDCVHYGGRTSLSPEYAKYQEETGMTDLQIHNEAHEYIYKEFADVLPVKIY